MTTDDAFLDSLTAHILARHTYLNHPFFVRLHEGKVTREQLREWAIQYSVIPRTHLINNAGKVAHAQLIRGGPFEQLLDSPYDLEVTGLLGDAIMDELGHTEISPANHWEPYLEFTDALEIPREEVVNPDRLLPTTLVTMHAWTESAKNFPLIDLIGSHNFVNDAANVKGFPKMCESFRKHYGLSDKAIYWFDLHGEVDKEHGSMARRILKKYVQSEEDRRRLKYAVTFGLGVFWTLHDGVMAAHVEKSWKA